VPSVCLRFRYFNTPPIILQGGIETGFRSVVPEEYKCRLLRVTGHKSHKVRATEVPLSADSLNDGDTFILDNGLTVFQWQGKNCGMFEKNHARDVAVRLDSDRSGKAAVVVLDQLGHDDDHHDDAFWALLGGKKEDHEIPEEVKETHLNAATPTVLWRCGDSKKKAPIITIYGHVTLDSTPLDAATPPASSRQKRLRVTWGRTAAL